MGQVYIGTSGWVYPVWRGNFYPKGLAQKSELTYLAQWFNSVEINGSFYALQSPSRYQDWAGKTPGDFVFAVKGHRFITHVKRLNDIEIPLANFFANGVLALGSKLGPILWQLPPSLRFNIGLLSDFVALLPHSTTAAAELARNHDESVKNHTWLTIDEDRPIKHALEVRHSSFANDAVFSLLRENNIALVIADTANTYPYIENITADFVYIRLHGDTELYINSYSKAALTKWANKIRQWSSNRDVYIYFDNTAEGHAAVNAMQLKALLA